MVKWDKSERFSRMSTLLKRFVYIYILKIIGRSSFWLIWLLLENLLVSSSLRFSAKVPDDVTVTGPPQSPRSTFQVDLDSLKLRPDFPVDVSGTVYSLITGSSTGPDSMEPISLDLTSIDATLTQDFWHDGYSADLCGSMGDLTTFLTTRRANLLQALASYGSIKGGTSPEGMCSSFNRIVKSIFVLWTCLRMVTYHLYLGS